MKIFCNCEKRQEEMLKAFENTILLVLTSTEKTNNKFVEWLGKVQVEHFKQLEKQSAKDKEVFENSLDKFLSLLQEKKIPDIIQKIDEPLENEIEKKQDLDNPLEDFPPIDMNNVKIQFEGEEEIYPIDIK